MNTTPTMAALSINTSHVAYHIQKQQTPLGLRWRVMAEMAGGRKKEIALCRSEHVAVLLVKYLRAALSALRLAGEVHVLEQ